jgi:hypothetical protein
MSKARTCEYGHPLIYTGVVDGGGDSGEALCDEWYCEICDIHYEGDCIESPDGESPDLADPDEPIDPVWSES